MNYTSEATHADGSVLNNDLAGMEEEGRIGSELTLDYFPENCEGEEKTEKELSGRFDQMEEEFERFRREIGWIKVEMMELRSSIRWMGLIVETMTVFGVLWVTVVCIFEI
jgi:hypothetical protein